jgi:hypothetical protein
MEYKLETFKANALISSLVISHMIFKDPDGGEQVD